MLPPKTPTSSAVSPRRAGSARPAAPRHLSMKTRKGMRMGKPSLRMRMVSRIPEYRSWLLTTSASKSPGSWGARGETPAARRAKPCPPRAHHAPASSHGQHRHRRRQESPGAGSHLLVVGFEAADEEGVAPAWERPHRPRGTGVWPSPCSWQPQAWPGCPPCPPCPP